MTKVRPTDGKTLTRMCQCDQDCGTRCITPYLRITTPIRHVLASTHRVLGLAPPPAPSPALRREVAQVRRRLTPAGRRQIAVLTDPVGLLAERDLLIGLGTDELVPYQVAVAPVAARHRPRPGERVVG